MRLRKSPVPAVVNAMSVDVEDYFHVSVFDGLVPRARWPRMESRVAANTRRLLDVFSECGIRSTFFVLGWVGEQHPNLVREIAARGHEVASHGFGHRLIYDQTPSQFKDDVVRARQVLEDACGRRVVGYRAPSYSITPRSLWAFDLLIEAGYEYDSSVFPIRHDRYGIPVSARHPFRVARQGGSLVEVPAATMRCAGTNMPVSGGGYFRLLPYAWTRWAINRVNRLERRPIVFYLHPWEIDPGQPHLQAGRLGRFRHYHNLEKTETRLRRLLREFRFDTVAALVSRASLPAQPDLLRLSLPYVW